MADLDRVRVAWTGFTGGPGVSTFYGVSGSELMTPLHTFFESVLDYLPSDVNLLVEPSGDKIDDETGDLVGTWSGSATGGMTGTGSYPAAAPAGACITWLSPIIRDAHRIKGRTFLVPLDASAYEGNGTLNATALGVFSAAAGGLVEAAGGNLRIWHRPRIAQAASPGHKALTAHAGSQAAVTASSVRDKVAVLRSRRD